MRIIINYEEERFSFSLIQIMFLRRFYVDGLAGFGFCPDARSEQPPKCLAR